MRRASDTLDAIERLEGLVDQREGAVDATDRRILSKRIRDTFFIIRMDLAGWKISDESMARLRKTAARARRQRIMLANV